MTGDIEIYPATKITSALALVHALRTAGKPVRDVYRGQGGGYWISFDGWEVDEAAVNEAVSKGWLVLTYPKKSREWWRLPEHMPAPRPRGWPRARVRGGRRMCLPNTDVTGSAIYRCHWGRAAGGRGAPA